MDKQLLEALKQAVKVIEMWHGNEVFNIYYNHSPEMKLICDVLPFDNGIVTEQADTADPEKSGFVCGRCETVHPTWEEAQHCCSGG